MHLNKIYLLLKIEEMTSARARESVNHVLLSRETAQHWKLLAGRFFRNAFYFTRDCRTRCFRVLVLFLLCVELVYAIVCLLLHNNLWRLYWLRVWFGPDVIVALLSVDCARRTTIRIQTAYKHQTYGVVLKHFYTWMRHTALTYTLVSSVGTHHSVSVCTKRL